jgi:hypothetical protein
MKLAPRRLGALGVTLALTVVAPGASQAADGKVRVLTSGNRSELVSSVPITGRPGAEPRRVFEIGGKRMPGLRAQDRIRAGVEVQLTNSCVRPPVGCVGDSYRFTPRIKARIVVTGKGGVRRRLGSGSENCGQREPHREHHCVLTISPRPRTLRPKDACKRCEVSVLVSASHPKAHGGERIAVGGLRPDGSIPRDRGRLGVTILRKGAPRARSGSTDDLGLTAVPPDQRRRVVLSKRIRGVRGGEQFEVEAELRTAIAHLPYSVRTTAHLVLARRSTAVLPDRRTSRIALAGGEISESNGFNCTQTAGSCTVRKLGVMRVRKSARKLFVNLVLLTGPKRARAKPGDVVRLGPAELRVRRYGP